MKRTLNQTVAFAYMEYDLKGRRTVLKTTRDGESWDETRWTIDPATGLCLSKTYADGSTVSYTYTPDGLPARTTWPGGRWQEDGYNAKREIVSTERSDGEETTFAYDVYSREIAATNDSAAIEITRDDRGRATNVTTTVAGTAHSLAREFDSAGRLARSGDLFHEYDSEGRLSAVSNSIAAVEYQYAADGRDAGYSLSLPNGAVFTRSVARDAMRRSLVTGITSSMNNNPVESIAYSYDALGRPTNRNNDAFGYNDRSEVTSASIMGWSPSPSTASYGYDDIGNLQFSSFNAATNAYTANCLNQYTSIQEISAPLAPPREPTYDLDGNMLSDGVLSFTYDAASRLKTVSSNGVTLVTNFYDAKSRRVKKVTANATTTFFYDDWNLVEERIAYADNTSSTIRYYWGKDISGTLQGAGGVGGLLWLTVDGTIYIPCYDSNGNVTRYLSVNGGALARYSYDAFGKLIARAGRRASFFRHRFSTKYFDSETGLYYYGYRFYHPGLMRWLNRDPIEEDTDTNLYESCGNAMSYMFDCLGLTKVDINVSTKAMDSGRGELEFIVIEAKVVEAPMNNGWLNFIQLKKQGNADWSLDIDRDFGPYYYTRRQVSKFTKRDKSGNRIVSLHDAPGGALDDKVYFYTAVVEINRDCWVASLPDFNDARYIKCYDTVKVITSVSWSFDPNNLRHYDYTGEVDGLFKRKAMLSTLQKLVNNKRWRTDLCPHTRVEVTE